MSRGILGEIIVLPEAILAADWLRGVVNAYGHVSYFLVRESVRTVVRHSGRVQGLPVTKIEWTTKGYEVVGRYALSRVSGLRSGGNQGCGVKYDSGPKLLLKRVLWPAHRIRSELLIDGFIKREIGRLVEKYLSNDDVFLDIGCGGMGLIRYLPEGRYYNALDLELSEFQIRRVLRRRSKVNLVLASATDIPAESKVASLIVSTEVFEHIPNIGDAIREIHRVAHSRATLICSIPNNYCHKYEKKGRHPGHVNDWTFAGFVEFMNSNGFELIEGFMKGYWIPLPRWLTRTSYQLPMSSKLERLNTNFFFVFRVV